LGEKSLSTTESIATTRERYYDAGAIYLSTEQQQARYLEARISIVSFQKPISESYKINPPKSFWGYCALIYQGCVIREIPINFPYQQLYLQFDLWRSLQEFICIYFNNLEANLNILHATIPGATTYVPLPATNLPTFGLQQPIDSIRFVGNEKMVFDFELYWLQAPSEDTACKPNANTIPPKGPIASVGQPYLPDSGEGSQTPTPAGTSDAPTDPSPTNQPSDVPAGDFGPRNPPHTDTCPAGYKVKIVGTVVAGDGIGTPIPGAIASITCPNAGPYTVSVASGPYNAGGGFGNYYFYLVTDNGGAETAIPAGWYGAPTATFDRCA
jgi:hypothetical protein